jgi:hypothetical protein
MQSARKVPDEICQILAEVCAEYRVRIDPDDPAVAVVMLNRLVLELALNRGSPSLPRLRSPCSPSAWSQAF